MSWGIFPISASGYFEDAVLISPCSMNFEPNRNRAAGAGFFDGIRPLGMRRVNATMSPYSLCNMLA